MNKPKITVIIPTRERPDVLKASLKTVTSQEYKNLDIIVSDNFSQDQTEEIVLRAGDPRIKYINTGKRVSMSHNWEFALSHVVDGWVTIIGDDDGLLPGSLDKVANIIQSTDIRAIRSTVVAYAWPSLTGKGFGRLVVPLSSGYKVRDSKIQLEKVLRGSAHYTGLPMLYNGGFVDMSVLLEMKRKTGAFYKSLTPDIYSAVSIPHIIGKFIYSLEPFAINGASVHSGGTSFLSGGTNQAPAEKFLSEENIPYHTNLPLCKDGTYPLSIQAAIYEAYFQSEKLWEKPVNLNFEQQLEVILALAGKHRDSVHEWGKIFAGTHNLNYDKIALHAKWKKISLSLSLNIQQLFRRINSYRTGSHVCPIKDVYSASIAASTVRALAPSRINNIFNLIGFLAGRRAI